MIWFIFWKKIKFLFNNFWINNNVDVFSLLFNFGFFRLSVYVGEKLRLNNLGLVDLLDENCLNKLVEKFSEFYDNVWMDVLEFLVDMN